MIIVPFYNIIVLPGVTFYFSREYFDEHVKKNASEGEEVIFLMLKEDVEREKMTGRDFYPIGVRGKVEGIDKEGNIGIHAIERLNIKSIRKRDGEFKVTVESRPEEDDLSEEELEERFISVRNAFLHFLSGSRWGLMVRNYVMQWKSLAEMASTLSYQLSISNEEKYEIISCDSVAERTNHCEQVLLESLELLKISIEAASAQEKNNEKLYREDAIKKQMDFLQKELDEMHPENVSDVREFERKIAESGMNETARKEAEKVLHRMKQEGENSHEYGLLYDYLDFVTGLSWETPVQEPIDLKEAEKILNEDHYGLKKVKNRILQQIAVMTLKKKQSGSILLFVGAPGTGKTSIGQSIAKALHRKYVRVSLGGIRDEAEIRGHRRTYIGAMPGRIMDGIQKSGSANPVVVLDEVDKLTRDYNGDPSSALLEVLDPEQNNSFTDHYMNVPYDLSNVLFVCTANTTDTIPEPLLNRMEVIRFSGYTAIEKRSIAEKHLLPRAMKEMGIKKRNLRVPTETIDRIISDFTEEAGVRGLKKRLDTLCRVAAVKLVKGERKTITVGTSKLREYLDQHPIRHDHILEKKKPGIVTGLAWTAAGGDILFIESVFTKGNGKVRITGQLGDVMKESAEIAVSLVKSMYPEHAKMFEKNDIHIHVPEGAVPKDGPSAGITLTTALASLVTDTSVSPEYGMTGEVSLRGVVMPIGGLPEKLMAAQRAGIKKVFIPEENVRDLDEVPEEVKSALTLLPVKSVKEVLKKVGIAEEKKKIKNKVNKAKNPPEEITEQNLDKTPKL
ncbi:MAG: endopeptidase La [Lachnospiraceae bacterium]|nr:endopeptidase La [Lachnospiraceae bacterium]